MDSFGSCHLIESFEIGQVAYSTKSRACLVSLVELTVVISDLDGHQRKTLSRLQIILSWTLLNADFTSPIATPILMLLLFLC